MSTKRLKEMQIDTKGEELRDLFFAQDDYNRGCYDTFNVRENVVEIPDEPIEWFDFSTDPPTLIKDRVDPEDGEYYKCYTYNGIKMRYHWEHDGYLEFILPDGTVYYNDDCKKDNNWHVKQ